MEKTSRSYLQKTINSSALLSGKQIAAAEILGGVLSDNFRWDYK